MSRLLGDTLPDDLVAALDGTGLAGKVGPAYLLVTSDEDGTPRPCMLSAGELLAVDGRRVGLALWRGSRTSANLARGGHALLCHVAPRTVVYVRGRRGRSTPAPTSISTASSSRSTPSSRTSTWGCR